MSLNSPGQAFRAALAKENPLQIVGAINANHALLAQRAGYQAIYLSLIHIWALAPPPLMSRGR